MSLFQLVSEYSPQGDQPRAIDGLTHRIKERVEFSTLLGVTGSGKTFTVANVIQNVDKPILIISHNKTLAAQLYQELKSYFPHNAVEFFISYYDYYQPEAYIPRTDTYIEKDASINEEIEQLRLSATSSLYSRRDVIVVASVSCIYGLGSPEDYEAMVIHLKLGDMISRSELLKRLVELQYVRQDLEWTKGHFRVRGDVIEVYPAYKDHIYRIELDQNVVRSLARVHVMTGKVLETPEEYAIFPAKHFLTPYVKVEQAIHGIEAELEERLAYFNAHDKEMEAYRLESRTRFDIEMLREIGHCKGIENYSRHLSGRKPGERPSCLIDFFPNDYMMIVDESHVTVPQVRGMYNGDQARKQTLVDYGFRLPSALDNRPQKFEEFETLLNQVIFVSATPGPYELQKHSNPVEQIIRPTGLLDPQVKVKPVEGQVDDLIHEIHLRVQKNERVLVITLTKKMSENLTEYLQGLKIRVRYLHSEIEALKRVEILKALRKSEFDVLVGINLLREGLDLPEVSLVAVLDADKEGFLRSQTSLIQIAGRAARHLYGEVILYADRVTQSMQFMIDETYRRRQIQESHNRKNNIVPRSIQKAIDENFHLYQKANEFVRELSHHDEIEFASDEVIYELEKEMLQAAEHLKFEEAAQIRDRIHQLKKISKTKKKRKKVK